MHLGRAAVGLVALVSACSVQKIPRQMNVKHLSVNVLEISRTDSLPFSVLVDSAGTRDTIQNVLRYTTNGREGCYQLFTVPADSSQICPPYKVSSLDEYR